MNKKQIFILIGVILGLVLLDQVSKIIIINNVSLGQHINVIPNFFVISHSKNTGISYGGFSDAPKIFFVLIYIFAIAVFAYLAKDINFKEKKLYSISLTMMIAGGIGNLIDRVLFGEVTDFLVLVLFQRELFGIFNIADILLVIGMLVFAADIILEEVLKWKKSSE